MGLQLVGREEEAKGEETRRGGKEQSKDGERIMHSQNTILMYRQARKPM